MKLVDIPGGFATLLGAIATPLAGGFVIVGAVVAWKSVQRQIHAAESLEKERSDKEVSAIELCFKSELLVYSGAIIDATSKWNLRASQPDSFPPKWEISEWPVFIDPLYYKTNIGKIGIIRQEWVGGALIGFYANLLEFNDQAQEALSGRLTKDVTSKTIAARLQLMARHLSHALDGLTDNRKLPIPAIGHQLELLCAPDGNIFAQSPNLPTNLQDVLSKLAGKEGWSTRER